MTSPFSSHASPFLAHATPWPPLLPESLAQPAQPALDRETAELAEWRTTALRCEAGQGRLEVELQELRAEWAGELQEVEGLARAAVQRSAELASTYTELRESCCETGSLFPAEHQRLLRLECLEQEIQLLGESKGEVECLKADLVHTEGERTRFEREAMQFRNEAEVLRGELSRAQALLQKHSRTLGELDSAGSQLDMMQLECADMRTAALSAELSRQHVTEELQEAIAEQYVLRDELQRLHFQQRVFTDSTSANAPDTQEIRKEKKSPAQVCAKVENIHIIDGPVESACRLDFTAVGHENQEFSRAADVPITNEQWELSRFEEPNPMSVASIDCLGHTAQNGTEPPEMSKPGYARQDDDDDEEDGFLPWGKGVDGGEEPTVFCAQKPTEGWPTPTPLSEWTSVWDSGLPQDLQANNKTMSARKPDLLVEQRSDEWPVKGGGSGAKDRGRQTSESRGDVFPLAFASVPAGGVRREARVAERGRPATRGRREVRATSARSTSSGSNGAWWDEPLKPACGPADGATEPLFAFAGGWRGETGGGVAAKADRTPRASKANGAKNLTEFTSTNPFATAPLSRRNPFAD